MQKKIAVIGAGSFGTCLANQLAKNGQMVTIVARDPDVVESINSKNINSKYFPDINLNKNLIASSELNSLETFSHIVIALPTQAIRATTAKMPSMKKCKIITASKGIEIGTLKLPMEIIKEVHPEILSENISVLSGPSFAIEVLEGSPTAVSIASSNIDTAKETQELFHAPHFRAYINQDPLGLEICGALKNVVAIAAGACQGLKFGKNSHAALMTRGLGEIITIGSKLGADPKTFYSLGGVGDLFLTCSSDKSRNYRVGLGLAAGLSKEQIIQKTKTTAEGIPTSRAAYQLACKLETKSSIIRKLYSVLYEDLDVQTAVKDLLHSEASAEFSD